MFRPRATVKCNECGKHMLETSLKGHKELKHRNAGKVFQCELCDYSTRCKTSLGSHQASHTATLQECPVCFRQVKKLAVHMQRNHAEERTRYGNL